MKKLLSLLLAVTMLLALTACGGAKDDAKPTEAPAEEAGETEAPAADAEETEAPAEEAEAPADAITLVMAEVNPIDSIIGQVDSAFKDKVEELSGGSSRSTSRPAACWAPRKTSSTPSCPAPTRSTSPVSPCSR